MSRSKKNRKKRVPKRPRCPECGGRNGMHNIAPKTCPLWEHAMFSLTTVRSATQTEQGEHDEL